MRLARNHGFHQVAEKVILLLEGFVISLNSFELNGASQCDGSSRDLVDSQVVCLVCVVVVNCCVDDVLDVVGEIHGDGDC